MVAAATTTVTPTVRGEGRQPPHFMVPPRTVMRPGSLVDTILYRAGRYVNDPGAHSDHRFGPLDTVRGARNHHVERALRHTAPAVHVESRVSDIRRITLLYRLRRRRCGAPVGPESLPA